MKKVLDNWYYIFLVLAVSFSIFTYGEYKANLIDPYYKKASRKCIVIDKVIEQYNANGSSRYVDLRNKMLLICKSEGVIFPVNVNTNTFYRLQVKDTVYFTLTKQEMSESKEERKGPNRVETNVALTVCFVLLFFVAYGFSRA